MSFQVFWYLFASVLRHQQILFSSLSPNGPWEASGLPRGAVQQKPRSTGLPGSTTGGRREAEGLNRERCPLLPRLVSQTLTKN